MKSNPGVAGDVASCYANPAKAAAIAGLEGDTGIGGNVRQHLALAAKQGHAVTRVVPEAGIEPARLAAGDFESPASTNFTTPAVLGSKLQIMAQCRE
jgi:hypothetical protein